MFMKKKGNETETQFCEVLDGPPWPSGSVEKYASLHLLEDI